MRARIARLLRRIARRPEPEPDVLAWLEDVAGFELTPEQGNVVRALCDLPTPRWITLGHADDDGLIMPRDDVAEFRRRWLDDMRRMQDGINRMHQRREAAERTFGIDGR